MICNLYRLYGTQPFYVQLDEGKVEFVMKLGGECIPRENEYIRISNPDFTTDIYRVAQVVHDGRTGAVNIYAHKPASISH
ncbi:hypothetical protein SEA_SPARKLEGODDESS_244 [Streptomyces phage SparkleGoddess]|uniref:Uncharacterized protein n=1 Tax=Streptomyces phage SparkleGoddess TaxID=2283305 RepID=A0A345MEE2_9CAUD|nr:hypothetical protein SEA_SPARKLEGODDESS_244 [Streptomyces phage SparkleGoddess]